MTNDTKTLLDKHAEMLAIWENAQPVAKDQLCLGGFCDRMAELEAQIAAQHEKSLPLVDQASELRALVAKQHATDAIYTFKTGLVIRESGKSRPIIMDELEQKHSQAMLDLVMSNAGQWIILASRAPVAVVA